jgi:hypothetical protein
MTDRSPDLVAGVPRSRIVIASMVGTTVEFYDFYIYATAAVSVFPFLFFPKGNPTTALLASLATFGLAFVARPIGSVLFGHFGDRIGRKATLVGSLLTMGIATFAIGLLPTYHQVGLLAPALLAILRFAQGLALGGEWSGAALLAVETAKPGKRAWAAMWLFLYEKPHVENAGLCPETVGVLSAIPRRTGWACGRCSSSPAPSAGTRRTPRWRASRSARTPWRRRSSRSCARSGRPSRLRSRARSRGFRRRTWPPTTCISGRIG